MKVNFGYLPEKISCTFNSGSFLPIENFDEVIWAVKENCHEQNGFVLSPTYKLVNSGEKKSKAPSFTPSLFRFVSTHTLALNNNFESLSNYELNPTFFILQLIGYVSGYRLMPEGYWFDLRIPQRPSINTLWTDKDLVKAIDIGLESWNKWDRQMRISMTNILFIFNRNKCYYWSFEQFSFEYKIIDTCYRLLEPNGADPHSKRLSKTLDKLKISRMLNQDEIKKIIDMRNNLVHELDWGDDLIAGGLKEEKVLLTECLHRINHRIIGRLLGYSGAYFESNPTSIGRYHFMLE